MWKQCPGMRPSWAACRSRSFQESIISAQHMQATAPTARWSPTQAIGAHTRRATGSVRSSLSYAPPSASESGVDITSDLASAVWTSLIAWLHPQAPTYAYVSGMQDMNPIMTQILCYALPSPKVKVNKISHELRSVLTELIHHSTNSPACITNAKEKSSSKDIYYYF